VRGPVGRRHLRVVPRALVGVGHHDADGRPEGDTVGGDAFFSFSFFYFLEEVARWDGRRRRSKKKTKKLKARRRRPSIVFTVEIRTFLPLPPLYSYLSRSRTYHFPCAAW
jgi:hypothetical protein